jgi:23S rRNA (adenine2503-C2)-methyltransferase
MEIFNEKPFRAKQVYQWIYKGVSNFEEMTDIPKPLKEKLSSRFYIGGIRVLKKLISKDDSTRKYLFLLQDHNIIECVVMKYYYGNTLCLSTQVGCRMGCKFCESTKQGLVRNLEPGEMMAQVLQANRDLNSPNQRSIRNIVLMGSGEPLDNYDNTLKFLRLLHAPEGWNMSYRNMTLSTCGLIPGIMKLAEENIPLTLSISLHAPNDDIRRQLMPVASAYGVSEIIDAAKEYFNKTGRRVTFEYSLIHGVNDKQENALELAARLKGFPCHVNVIPVNEIKDSEFTRSNEFEIRQFIKILQDSGIQVTRRRELGQDIQGACGQLKRGYLDSLS